MASQETARSACSSTAASGRLAATTLWPAARHSSALGISAGVRKDSKQERRLVVRGGGGGDPLRVMRRGWMIGNGVLPLVSR